jgi:hypothetical protein
MPSTRKDRSAHDRDGKGPALRYPLIPAYDPGAVLLPVKQYHAVGAGLNGLVVQQRPLVLGAYDRLIEERQA